MTNSFVSCLDTPSVLIVEDDLLQQRILQALLVQHGIDSLFFATNGQEAIALLDENLSPAAILCDLHMPDMDGVAFLREVARRKLDPYVSVISSAAKDVIASVVKMAKVSGLSRVSSIIKPANNEKIGNILREMQGHNTPNTSSYRTCFKPTKRDIVDAIEKGHIKPFYQAQFCVESGDLSGVEALARWEHPEFGVLTPGLFLPEVQKAALSHKVTRNMLASAISEMSQVLSKGIDVTLSVNVEHDDLVKEGFFDFVVNCLSENRFPGENLVLEVVESSNAKCISDSLEALSRFRLHDINISIDDFGTGYSSLSQLSDGPFTELKMDRSFISGMLQDEKILGVVKSMICLAENLGLHLVAEGVEEEEQLTMLRSLGCDTVQGFLLAKPCCFSAFAKPYFDTQSKN